MDNNGVDQNGRSLSLLPESSNTTETIDSHMCVANVS